MMGKQTLEAVFERGAFRLLAPDPITIPEGQRVQIVLETEESPEAILTLAIEVYKGLSEKNRGNRTDCPGSPNLLRR
jgi:predicted DNA-binding antitoxin AbrB/MazE fold protein